MFGSFLQFSEFRIFNVDLNRSSWRIKGLQRQGRYSKCRWSRSRSEWCAYFANAFLGQSWAVFCLAYARTSRVWTVHLAALHRVGKALEVVWSKTTFRLSIMWPYMITKVGRLTLQTHRRTICSWPD